MRSSRFLATAFLLCSALPSAGFAQDSGLSPPAGIATYADGRTPIESLYRAWLGLVDRGWTAELIVDSQPSGTTAPLPIVALHSPVAGPAVWLLAGIHGEEPAGPNAIAETIAGSTVGPVVDSSIDELVSALRVRVGGEELPGPAARTVLVFDTPAAALPLTRRVDAHAALIRRLAALPDRAGP